MPHALITGTSGSGKTTLAKALCQTWRRKGFATVILDPLFSSWPAASVQFHDAAAFLHYMRRARRCALFADEAPAAIGRNDRTFDTLATQARHFGHEVHFLTQRPTQLHPTIRENCERLYAFRLSPAAAQMLADEFTCPALAELIPTLERFEFVYAARYETPRICKLNLVAGQWVVKTRVKNP